MWGHYFYLGQIEVESQALAATQREFLESLGPWLAGTWPPYAVNNPMTSKWEPGRDPQPDRNSLLLAHGFDASNILIQFDPDYFPF